MPARSPQRPRPTWAAAAKEPMEAEFAMPQVGPGCDTHKPPRMGHSSSRRTDLRRTVWRLGEIQDCLTPGIAPAGGNTGGQPIEAALKKRIE